jgi:hypothetical protein
MDAEMVQTVARTLDLLAECEEAVAAFYEGCAEAWPKDRLFWKEIGEEERGHARNLHRMKELVLSRPEAFAAAKLFSPFAVRTMIERLRREREKVVTGKLPEVVALSISNDLEDSLIEKRYHEVVHSEDFEYHLLLREITRQTSHHAARIRQMRGEGNLQTVYAL